MARPSGKCPSRVFEWLAEMELYLEDLVRLARGQLRLANMPPRDGELAVIRRIVLTPEAVQPGDLFWCLQRQDCNLELAFLRGALGVALAGESIEPWPGRFSLLVDDPVTGLERLIAGLAAGEQFFHNPPELKDLQLSAGAGVDIYPPVNRKCRIANVKCLTKLD